MSAEGGTKAVLAALAANLGIAVTKIGAFALTGSSSMLAESLHSAADSGNQVLLLVGSKRAAKQADAEHPFGYGRSRFTYAFLVAVILFSLGGLFALYEGIHKLQNPEAIESWQWVPIAVLVVAMGLESFSLRTALGEIAHVRGSATLRQFVRESKSPELVAVLLEDVAALTGLVFALLGVSLTLVTGDGRWDAAGTLAIGALLVVVAVVLARETSSLLLGESVTPAHTAAIRSALLAEPSIEEVVSLRSMHLAPEEILVAAKVVVRLDGPALDLARGLDAAAARVKAALPFTAHVYIDPESDRVQPL